MAKPQTTTESSHGAVFQVFRASQPDADLAYNAAEEIREMAGQNVLAAISTLETKMNVRFDALNTKLDALAESTSSKFKVLGWAFTSMIGLLLLLTALGFFNFLGLTPPR